MLVLFIDDDTDDYRLFCDALRTFNETAECLQAFNGRDALNVLNQSSSTLPDYIFLDVNMPIMGGWECLKKIKANPILKDLPVIVYTTSSDASEIELFRKMGAEAFITKPSTFKQLVKTLKKILAP
jgi:CheY-like chemotaxis protein